MKVLMFGWEFPPHISGGLGTACFGLTKCLLKEKLNVLFVVPRLYGDERENSFLINASNVLKHRKIPAADSQEERVMNSDAGTRQPDSRYAKDIAYLEVSSALSPYKTFIGPPGFRKTGLRSWNYAMVSDYSTSADVETALRNDPDSEVSERDPDRFIFSGTYGKNLMEEVDRFGRVGGMIAQEHAFDIIHAHDWMTFTAGIQAKQKSGKPLIVHVHSTEFDRAGENVNKDILAIERRGLQEADRVIAVSNWTKEIIMSRYHIPADKITVIHNGILPKGDLATFEFPHIASHFITFLGRVTRQKGPKYFVEAAQKVLREFPRAHFLVAGAGDLLPQTIERVAKLNMSASFHFTGFLSGDQVDRIWSLTDVYVMPSVSEPFGIAPLEAIQGGVPVILSNQSGVAEVMPHAIKVDFWDTQALAGAICSVLRYESLSRVLRQEGKRDLEHLSWDRAARDVKFVYHELTSKPTRHRN